MTTLTLTINFDKDLDPDRIADALEVFRSQIEYHLLKSSQGRAGVLPLCEDVVDARLRCRSIPR